MKVFWPKNVNFEDALCNLNRKKLYKPFAEETIAFTQKLSKRFVRIRSMPEVVALGYWLRKSNIKQMQEEFERATRGKVVRGRGTAFHIAPSNVDTIFVYSWMLSLLAGNRNIIRISSKTEINELLQIILEELPNFISVAEQTLICTYGHNQNATEVLSLACHTRVIWGGDETIKVIRNIPLAPIANELAFPDRFSLAILNSEKVKLLDNEALDALLEKFYNDVFWFDQMACSSPRLVVWIGEKIETFWTEFERKIQKKQHELLAATQVLKYSTSLQLAAENYVEKVVPITNFSRIKLNDVPVDVREKHCGGGVFFEYEVENLIDLEQIIIDKDQTIAYFGFEQPELEELIESISTRGIDRIVPIGQALNFDGVWDGQSFLTSFTREVIIL
ncbi:acyl-CoA reductase [Lysinibacillus sp. fkY74-1]|uniref:acyl-CoA reductase n=1 Tax=Lysinibacillus sphaericus TaxID=1421 RepID=UPI00056CD1F5|nr:acyl-CoA reductase [Lysinibacillus sphaericus]QTB23150.1 acyl-CoA reductase [Lysinibacillus sphaericus]